MSSLHLHPSTTKKIERIIGQSIPKVEFELEKGKYFPHIFDHPDGLIIDDPEVIKEWMSDFIQTPMVIKSLRPMLKRIIPRIFKLLKIQSVIQKPLIINGNPIGILELASEKKFTHTELAHVRNIAGHLTTAIHQKREEELIHRSEKKYLSLVNEINDGLYITDREGKFTFVNTSLVKMLGLKDQSEALGHAFLEFVVPGQADQLQNRYAEAMQDRSSSTSLEVSIRRKNGSHGIFRIKPLTFTTDGQVAGSRGIVNDITDQAQVELELSETEERFRELINIAPIGIAIHQDGKWALVNEYTVRMLGYESREDLIGKSALDIVHPDDREAAAKRIRESGETGKVAPPMEEKLLKKDGSTLDAIITSVPITYRAKPAFEVTAVNISDLKQAEESLRKSESKFRSIFQNVTDFLYVHDLEGNFLETNLAFKKEYGYTEKDFDHLNIGDLIPERYKQQFKRYLKQILSERNTSGLMTILTKDGSERVVEYRNSLIYESGHPVAVQGSARDITSRIKTEKRLKFYTERINAINKASHELTNSLDLKKVNKSCAKTAMDIFDATDVTIFTLNGQQLIPILNVGAYSKEIESMRLELGEGLSGMVAQTGKAQIVNRIDKTGIGQQVPDTPVEPESLMCAPLKLKDEVIGVMTLSKRGTAEFYPEDLGFFENLADISAAAIQNARLFEASRKSERLKSLFLSNMSHEIRTPLNAIVGYSDLIQMAVGDKLAPEEQQFFDYIHMSTERLLKTIHSILDMSQIEALGYHLKTERFNLNDMAENILGQMRSMANEKKLNLQFNSDIRDAEIKADKYCIEQSLNHLLDNAIKYTKEGSVSVDLTEKNKDIVLRIRDTGVGISEDYQKELFDSFTQESMGYTKRFQGIGLGLALTKRYLDLNHVSIGIHSQKGRGTTFILTFPRA